MYRAHHPPGAAGRRRRSPLGAPARVVTTFRVGKLVTRGGQSLCLVRTLSDRAATLDVDVPFEGDEAATLEIGRETIAGTLVRLGESRAEMRCADPVELGHDPGAAAAAGPCPGSRSTLLRASRSAGCASPRGSATFRPTA